MSGRNLDSFMQGTDADLAAFGTLSEEEQARLFAGGMLEGETAAGPEADNAPPEAAADGSATPDAAPSDGQADLQPASEPKQDAPKEPAAEPITEAQQPQPAGDTPDVLTKDGRHTIPYTVLQDERERSKQLEATIREQAEMIGRMHAQGGADQQQQPKSDPAPDKFEALERQYIELVSAGDPDGAVRLRAEINAEIRKQAFEQATAGAQAQALQAIQAQQEQLQIQSAVNDVIQKYPFLNDSEAAQADLIGWRDVLVAQGKGQHEAIIEAAAKIAPQYQSKDQQPAEPAKQADTNVVDALKKAGAYSAQMAAGAMSAVNAAEAAKANPKPPASLSDVPSATAAPHDEVAAMREMSGRTLMDKFAGKSHDQIMDLMKRLV